MKRFFVLCLTVILAIASFVFVGCSNKKDVATSDIVYYYSKDGGEIVTDNDGNPVIVKTIYKGEKVDGVSDQDLNEFGKDTRGYTVKQYRILKDTYKDQDTVYILIDIEVKRYSITYDYNGGVIDPAARSNPKTTYRLSDSIDLLKTAPAVRDGYVHVGWAESPNATVDECIKNTKDCADNPRNLVLYAIYVPAE